MPDTVLIEYGPTNDGRHLIKVGGEQYPDEFTKAGACKEVADEMVAKLRAELPGVEVRLERRYFTSSVPRQITEAKAKAAQAGVDNADAIAELMGMTNDELEDALADGSHDEYLDAIEAAEKKGKHRIGAIHAIEGRRFDIKLEDEQDVADAQAAREEAAAAEADAREYAETWGLELAILDDTPPEALLAYIAAGDHDALLDSLTQVEAEKDSPRQEVLDALSDRAVARAQELANEAKAAEEAEAAEKAKAEQAKANDEHANDEHASANTDGTSDGDGNTAETDTGDGESAVEATPDVE